MTRIVSILIAGAATLIATGANAQTSPPASWTGAMQPDPKCMADVAWEVDPAAAPIRVYGCRPLSEIPAPNADGWVTYTRPLVNGNDAGSVMVKLIAQTSVSSWKFEVIDTQGGSGSFGFIVSGEADANGFIQKPVVVNAK